MSGFGYSDHRRHRCDETERVYWRMASQTYDPLRGVLQPERGGAVLAAFSAGPDGAAQCFGTGPGIGSGRQRLGFGRESSLRRGFDFAVFIYTRHRVADSDSDTASAVLGNGFHHLSASAGESAVLADLAHWKRFGVYGEWRSAELAHGWPVGAYLRSVECFGARAVGGANRTARG
jgi:hypothetical protein